MTQRLGRSLPSGVAAIACAVVLAAPRSAAADELIATRAQPLDEISHTVSVRIADGVAIYTVQRQFLNRGKLAEEARLAIDLPTGAAATGLRIRAAGAWHTGELLDRELAADRYRELTGLGVHDARDPALLFWVSSTQLSLQVFPVLPGKTNTVEYTLTVPTRYAGGRYWLTYPRVDPAAAKASPELRRLVAPVVTVQPAWSTSAGGISVDGKPAAAGAPIALAAHAPPRWRAAGDDLAAAPADPDAGPPAPERYGASTIAVPASDVELRYTVARLRVELQHPNLEDVSLELATPAGELLPVASGGLDELGAAGSYEVRLPAPTRAGGRWRLVARSGSTGTEAGALQRWSISFGGAAFSSADTPVLIPGGAESGALAVVSVEPPAGASWTGRLGRVVASPAHAFTRLELDAAPRLSSLPKRAQVVFVADASISAGEEHLAAQLAILRAYLAHVPDAEVEVIAVRRTARRVFNRFAPAPEALRLLDTAVRGGAFALGNGSALDEGAQLAATLLAGRPGPHRVLLATDERMRSSLSESTALASLSRLAPSAVVHLVLPTEDFSAKRPSLARAESSTFAALATAHGGIAAQVVTQPGGTLAAPADLVPVVLELVRPTRIEGIAVAGAAPTSFASVLHEGQGLRVLDAAPAADAPASLSLTGQLWSTPVRLELAATPAFSTAAAAFVIASDDHASLSDAELRAVALSARAVSPVTSYLAIEPGVRPSRIGLEDNGTGWGTIGSGSYGSIGSGCGGFGVVRARPALSSLVDVTSCVRRHGPVDPWSVRLDVETTRDEIVDVKLVSGTGPLASCITEAVWATRLDPAFSAELDTHTVEFSGP